MADRAQDTESVGRSGGARRSRLLRGLVLAAAVVVAAPLLLLAHPRTRAALRWTTGFAPLPADARVRFEPGAEALAARLADLLPEAVARVEAEHGLPFRAPFRVHACASHESFTRRLGESPGSRARGMALHRDVWISPLAVTFEGEDTLQPSLIHELSHLHLSQHRGVRGSARGLPTWFVEGLADSVAGTGHEIVTREQALAGLARGRRLVPDDRGRFLFPRRAEHYGLSWPMLHGQSRVFVEHLRERDAERFTLFVTALLGGTRFADAFETHFGESLEGAWIDFLRSLPG